MNIRIVIGLLLMLSSVSCVGYSMRKPEDRTLRKESSMLRQNSSLKRVTKSYNLKKLFEEAFIVDPERRRVAKATSLKSLYDELFFESDK